MKDLIQVLPDVVANQIAAGEVIQRPASVIKELVENAVDAGADRIQIILKDAGRTLIQIVDNGCGMSENDARICFERHATSKIRSAEDLFAIRTMGFRGEALASIASIAQVEMKTKRSEDENGTHIRIEGSELLFQQPVACQNGTSLAVRNLFYNVPARRRFLKSNSTELKHIITEFQRIALTNPAIRFSMHHNDTEVFNLDSSGLRERIIKLIGKSLDSSLINIHTETSIVNVSGFIGKPEKARKTYGEQFFFVNGRFMKHPYLHKAVMSCYEALLPPDSIPSYFIYLDTDPARIDINIHPTKTEIKFDEERAVFQILQASVKEGLGKFNITPSLDFNQEGAIDIPVLSRGTDIRMPQIDINTAYNPFDTPDRKPDTGRSSYTPPVNRGVPDSWETLYTKESQKSQVALDQDSLQGKNIIQLRGKFLLTPTKSGLMIIHVRRALERIHYEQYLKSGSQEGVAQKLLYPLQFELNPADLATLKDLQSELEPLGFEIDQFGGSSVILNAMPSALSHLNGQKLIEDMVELFNQETRSLDLELRQKVALNLAKVASQGWNKSLTIEEMQGIIDALFACDIHQTTGDGKKIMTILQIDDIEKRF